MNNSGRANRRGKYDIPGWMYLSEGTHRPYLHHHPKYDIPPWMYLSEGTYHPYLHHQNCNASIFEKSLAKLCSFRIIYSLKYYHTIAWYKAAKDVKLLQKYFYSLQLKRTQWNSLLNIHEIRIYAFMNMNDSQELCLLVYVCYEIWIPKKNW